MRLSGLFIYPVKGLRGLALDEAAVEPWGLALDRRWMLVDAQGRFLSQRTLPMLARLDAIPSPGGLLLSCGGQEIAAPAPGADAARIEVVVWRSRLRAASAGDGVDAWLCARLGVTCRLVFLDDPRARPIEPPPGAEAEAATGHVSFADSHPVLLTGEGSLAALNHALAGPVGMDRFRPNLVMAGAGAWAEDGWRALRVGGVTFSDAGPCSRCVVTGIDQRSGETPAPGEPLTTLGRLNRQAKGIIFGRNLIPRAEGTLRLGDPVEILA